MEITLNYGRRAGLNTNRDKLLIEDCDRNSDKLSDKELSFIDTMHNRLVGGMPLMTNQKAVLITIWKKVRELNYKLNNGGSNVTN